MESHGDCLQEQQLASCSNMYSHGDCLQEQQLTSYSNMYSHGDCLQEQQLASCSNMYSHGDCLQEQQLASCSNMETHGDCLQEQKLAPCSNLKSMKGFVCVSRYLCHYERLHFHGEDPDIVEQVSESRPSRHAAIVQAVPMAYNVSQHDVPNSSRNMMGLSQSSRIRSEYDKLAGSLGSCLPNEQDFAVNTATILSNEGNRVLRLKEKPALVSLLLSQVGVWNPHDPLLREIHKEIWSDLESRDAESFWREVLDPSDPDVRELAAYLWSDHRPPDRQLPHDLGVKNTAGQKILRVSPPLFWGGLRHAGLDTLTNIAGQLELGAEDVVSRMVMRAAREGVVQSRDRQRLVRSLELVARLCEPNEELPLDFQVYHRLVALLTVADTAVLVFALEALYHLSELGTDPCDKIVSVTKSVSILVTLLTMDPSPPRGMKLVEIMVPNYDNLKSELLHLCCRLRANYEAVPGYSIGRNDLYAEYVNYCSKAGKKGVVNANVFANCLKSVFPQCGLRKLESAAGIINCHHDGLRRKGTVIQRQTVLTATPQIKVAPARPPSQPSPILKAQLSVPPRPPATTAVATTTTVAPAPSVVVPAPNSSPLIKSLLANKVARNLQRQQQDSTPPPTPAAPPRVNGLAQDILAQAISQAGIIDDDDEPSKPDVPSTPPALQTAANGGGLLARLIADPKHKLAAAAQNPNLLQTMLGPEETSGGKKLYKSSPLLNGLLDKGKMAEQQQAQQSAQPPVAASPQQTQQQQQQLIQQQNGHLKVEECEPPKLTNDLSSISDITRTLESASKTISKTNMDCGTVTCAQTVIRAGQQVLLVSAPTQLAGPNTKFWLLYPTPTATTTTAKMEVDAQQLLSFPRVSLATTAPTQKPIAPVKRPPPIIEPHSMAPKKIKMEAPVIKERERTMRVWLCRAFKSAGAVLHHASVSHTGDSDTAELGCQWENCSDAVRRRKLALLTHLQDWHCSEQVLRLQAARRQQFAQTGKTALPPPPLPPPHPGYTHDAAMLAIRRHAQSQDALQ
ncbi:ARID2, partial [Cordylochernes scorpioides]